MLLLRQTFCGLGLCSQVCHGDLFTGYCNTGWNILLESAVRVVIWRARNVLWELSSLLVLLMLNLDTSHHPSCDWQAGWGISRGSCADTFGLVW